jgi:hypothetical protein
MPAAFSQECLLGLAHGVSTTLGVSYAHVCNAYPAFAEAVALGCSAATQAALTQLKGLSVGLSSALLSADNTTLLGTSASALSAGATINEQLANAIATAVVNAAQAAIQEADARASAIATALGVGLTESQLAGLVHQLSVSIAFTALMAAIAEAGGTVEIIDIIRLALDSYRRADIIDEEGTSTQRR